MLTYITFKTLHLENSNEQQYYNIQCKSETTNIQLICKIIGNKQQTVLPIPKNIFVGPSYDKIKIIIRPYNNTWKQQNEEEQESNQSIIYQNVLRMGEYYQRNETLLKSNQDVVGQQTIKLRNTVNSKILTLQFKYKIRVALMYSGISPLIAIHNINKTGHHIKKPVQFIALVNQQQNCQLNTQQNQNIQEQMQEGLRIQLPWHNSVNVETFQEPSIKSRNSTRNIPGSIMNKGMKTNTSSKFATNKQQSKIKTKTKTQSVYSHKQRLYFYKGPCKNKNLFSCMDQTVVDEQINVMEPAYYSNNKQYL